MLLQSNVLAGFNGWVPTVGSHSNERRESPGVCEHHARTFVHKHVPHGQKTSLNEDPTHGNSVLSEHGVPGQAQFALPQWKKTHDFDCSRRLSVALEKSARGTWMGCRSKNTIQRTQFWGAKH